MEITPELLERFLKVMNDYNCYDLEVGSVKIKKHPKLEAFNDSDEKGEDKHSPSFGDYSQGSL